MMPRHNDDKGAIMSYRAFIKEIPFGHREHIIRSLYYTINDSIDDAIESFIYSLSYECPIIF